MTTNNDILNQRNLLRKRLDKALEQIDNLCVLHEQRERDRRAFLELTGTDCKGLSGLLSPNFIMPNRPVAPTSLTDPEAWVNYQIVDNAFMGEAKRLANAIGEATRSINGALGHYWVKQIIPLDVPIVRDGFTITLHKAADRPGAAYSITYAEDGGDA